MIKFREKGTLKAEISQELGLLQQILSLVLSTKKKFPKEIKSATPVNTPMVSETTVLLIGS